MTGTTLDTRAKTIAISLLAGPWLFVSVVVTVIAVLAAASIPWPRNRLLAFLDTGALSLVVARETTVRLRIEEAQGSSIWIEQGQVVDTVVPSLASMKADAMLSAQITGGALELSLVRLAPNAEFTVLVEPPNRLEVRLRGNASADLVLAGPVRVYDAARHEEEQQFDVPTILTLRPRPGATPLRLQLAVPTRGAPAIMDGIYVSGLTLTRDWREDSSGTPFRADTKSGRIRLVDIERERELRAGEPLRLDGLDAYVPFVEIGASSVHVDIVGHAGRVVLGPSGYADDITPSVLEYLVGQESLKLLWGVGVVILAMLWNARRWALAARSSD
jgi:hypothetical protein